MQFIKVRIYHGYIRKPKGWNKPKEIGGLFGGHVVIQIKTKIYGFIYKDKRKIHLFSKIKNKNCYFHAYTLEEWEEIVEEKKETIVSIPVNEEELSILLQYYRRNIQEPEIDYSFFGERCSSNCYHLLKRIGKIDGGHYLFNAFYPGQFKRKLLKTARTRGYQVQIKKGSNDRIWQ